MTSKEELLDLLHAGHWFLKHRAKGDMPHRRFVFVENALIIWATRQDRTGKLGSMPVDTTMLVVPGSATSVTSSKKRLQERRNRLFSIVGATRSLDLETGTEAERHVWVHAFSMFVKLQRSLLAGAATAGSASGTLQEQLASQSGTHSHSEAPAGAVQAHLVRQNTEELMAGVRFPLMKGSFHVLLGDIVGSWQAWQLLLQDGELSAPDYPGSLALEHVAAVVVDPIDGGAEFGHAGEGLGELRLR